MARHLREHASEDERPSEGLAPQALADLALRRWRIVLGSTLTGLVVCLAWLWTKPPVYRATAKLLLEDERASQGVLGELALLAGAPKAAAEIELLRARSTVEQVVARASEPGAAVDAARHLGLDTLVEDERLRPLPAVFDSSVDSPASASPGARLEARIGAASAALPRPTLRVVALGGTRVRVESGGRLSRLGFGEVEQLELDLAEPRAFELAGLNVQLSARGELVGGPWRLISLGPEEAIERVRENLRVAETERNSGVIELSYSDSDPRRAADTLEALCSNYLERKSLRGQKRASQTLDFIRAQLGTQNSALERAEREVSLLQASKPRSVDVPKAAQALIDQISALELQRVRVELARVALGEALDLLADGALEPLSRLPVELYDPLTRGWLEHISRLSAESAVQERTDAGAYRALLQEHRLTLEAERETLALRVREAEAALDGLRAGNRAALGRLGERGASDDTLLSSQLAQLAQTEQQIAELQQRYTALHPEILAARAARAELLERVCAHLSAVAAGLAEARDARGELLDEYDRRSAAEPARERERIQSAVDSLVTRTRAHLVSRRAGLEAEEAGLRDQRTRLESELGALPEESRAVAGPLRRLSAHSEIVKFLLAREQEAEISRAATLPGADVIDAPAIPVRRHGPSIPAHLLGGLLFGVVAGLGLALLRETFGRGILYASELEAATGLPVLGQIPDFRSGRTKVKRADARFIALRDDPRGATAESYRSLRANLKHALAASGEVRAIAFTSCAQGEGKSATNIDVALAFGLSGKRVLLVDADMRRPSVHMHLGLEQSPGLSDVLTGKVSWRDLVRKEVERNVDVITAGRQPANPGELLEGPSAARMLEEARGAYDLVVFDVPPALAVADIEAFAARLDAVLLVCRAGRVSPEVVGEAAERLRQVGANLIGAVLNAVGAASRRARYGHGYGYGYGYGYGNDKESKRANEQLQSVGRER
jgi:capsular exopolysaccharide synthesis family protein